MLLLDFCNIKEWTCSTILDLYKKHRIVHSEWGKRSGFEKWCTSKLLPKQPLVFALTEVDEIEPWLSEDNKKISPSEWLNTPIIFPSDKRHADIWDYLQRSQGNYRGFLDKCSEGVLDLNFANDIIEDFQVSQGINFLLVESKEKWGPEVTMSKEYLETIEDHINWEILSLFFNRKPDILREVRKCKWCETYFIASRTDRVYCSDSCGSTYRSRDFRKTGKHTEYMRKNTSSGVYIKVADRR